MARQLIQRNDNMIGLHTDTDRHYIMTAEDFLVDFGNALPALPDGITLRVYEPTVRHALQISSDVVDGGPMPWPPGDDALARADEIMKAKEAKRIAEEAKKIDDVPAM